MQITKQWLKVITPVTLAVACVVACPALALEDQQGAAQWVGTWAASTTASLPNAPVFNNQTLREIVHTSVGGNRVRVRLSNRFGIQPLVIGAAHIAIRRSGSSILPGSDRALTFNGHSSASVPLGAPVLSDAVQLTVPALTDLAVS